MNFPWFLFVGVSLCGAVAVSSPSAAVQKFGGWPNQIQLAQARDTNLTGVWTNTAGDRFEISSAAGKVLMTTTGTLKSKISGNFDGAAFTGAYQTADNPPDRGVVRFLLTQDGKLQGTWQSYVNGKHGNWSLSR